MSARLFLRGALAAVFACAFALAAHAAGADAPSPYVLKDTEVHTLRAARLGRDYELYIALPPSYAASPERRYPVVFVTDAPYAFPLTRAIAARVGGHSKALPEFILVGLGYAKGDTPEYSRRRDYTPTPHGDSDARSDMPGRPAVFGGAEDFRRFVADEVFPFMASHYRADMSHRVFAGHSYGGLWGAYVLLRSPDMFQGYVLGSPSLWFDNLVVFAQERSYAASHKDLRADVWLGAGALETREIDMVADTRALARTLASRRYPGLRVHADIIPGENHLTVAPVLITRGLQWTLAPRP